MTDDHPPIDPLVTVAVPVRNGEAFLDEALRSLLDQTFGDFELLVGDNCSTDATPEICRRHAAADPRVRYLPSDRDLGLARNHNRLFHEARGRYFKWAAADDRHDPRFLAACVEVLEAEPEVVLCFARALCIDEHGRPLGPLDSMNFATGDDAGERFRAVMLHQRKGTPVYGVVRREVLAATPLLGSHPSSDQPLLAELAAHGRFHEVQEPLFLRREHGDRSMTRFRSDRHRMELYDPAGDDRVLFPRWRLAREFVRAARRAPLDRRQRRLVYAGLVPWARMWWKDLALNVAGGLRAAALDLLRRRRRTSSTQGGID